jgi:hypothetical protein
MKISFDRLYIPIIIATTAEHVSSVFKLPSEAEINSFILLLLVLVYDS